MAGEPGLRFTGGPTEGPTVMNRFERILADALPPFIRRHVVWRCARCGALNWSYPRGLVTAARRGLLAFVAFAVAVAVFGSPGGG